MTKTSTIEDWLTLAWTERDQCPPPELFLASEWSDLSDEDRGRATRHLQACPACAAERDLAQAFEAAPLANPRAESEIEALLGHVAFASKRAAGAGGGRVVRFPAPGRLVPQRALALAAAALVVVAVAAVVRDRIGPGLPDVPTDDVMRSGRIALVAPVGEVEAIPATLEWVEVADAATYRVTLTAVDDTVLWTGDVGGSPLRLPAAARSILRPRVVYFWRVEAFDASGARVAWSPPSQFRFLSEASAAGETPS